MIKLMEIAKSLLDKFFLPLLVIAVVALFNFHSRLLALEFKEEREDQIKTIQQAQLDAKLSKLARDIAIIKCAVSRDKVSCLDAEKG